MNVEQFFSLLRTVLQLLAGLAVQRGYLDAETATGVAGAIVFLAVTGWGLYARRNTGLVASAAAVPGVSQILTLPKLVGLVPSPKVIVAAPAGAEAP